MEAQTNKRVSGADTVLTTQSNSTERRADGQEKDHQQEQHHARDGRASKRPKRGKDKKAVRAFDGWSLHFPMPTPKLSQVEVQVACGRAVAVYTRVSQELSGYNLCSGDGIIVHSRVNPQANPHGADSGAKAKSETVGQILRIFTIAGSTMPFVTFIRLVRPQDAKIQASDYEADELLFPMQESLGVIRADGISQRCCLTTFKEYKQYRALRAWTARLTQHQLPPARLPVYFVRYVDEAPEDVPSGAPRRRVVNVHVPSAWIDPSSPIHLAALEGDVSRLNHCLRAGQSPLNRDCNDRTPLHCACKVGHLRSIVSLLQHLGQAGHEDTEMLDVLKECKEVCDAEGLHTAGNTIQRFHTQLQQALKNNSRHVDLDVNEQVLQRFASLSELPLLHRQIDAAPVDTDLRNPSDTGSARLGDGQCAINTDDASDVVLLLDDDENDEDQDQDQQQQQNEQGGQDTGEHTEEDGHAGVGPNRGSGTSHDPDEAMQSILANVPAQQEATMRNDLGSTMDVTGATHCEEKADRDMTIRATGRPDTRENEGEKSARRRRKRKKNKKSKRRRSNKGASRSDTTQ